MRLPSSLATMQSTLICQTYFPLMMQSDSGSRVLLATMILSSNFEISMDIFLFWSMFLEAAWALTLKLINPSEGLYLRGKVISEFTFTTTLVLPWQYKSDPDLSMNYIWMSLSLKSYRPSGLLPFSSRLVIKVFSDRFIVLKDDVEIYIIIRQSNHFFFSV